MVLFCSLFNHWEWGKEKKRRGEGCNFKGHLIHKIKWGLWFPEIACKACETTNPAGFSHPLFRWLRFFFSLSETHLGFLVKQIFYTVAPCAWMSAWFSAARKHITTGRHPGEAWPTVFDWGFQRDFSPWTREAKFYRRKKYLEGKNTYTKARVDSPGAATDPLLLPAASSTPGLCRLGTQACCRLQVKELHAFPSPRGVWDANSGGILYGEANVNIFVQKSHAAWRWSQSGWRWQKPRYVPLHYFIRVKIILSWSCQGLRVRLAAASVPVAEMKCFQGELGLCSSLCLWSGAHLSVLPPSHLPPCPGYSSVIFLATFLWHQVKADASRCAVQEGACSCASLSKHTSMEASG